MACEEIGYYLFSGVTQRDTNPMTTQKNPMKWESNRSPAKPWWQESLVSDQREAAGTQLPLAFPLVVVPFDQVWLHGESLQHNSHITVRKIHHVHVSLGIISVSYGCHNKV